MKTAYQGRAAANQSAPHTGHQNPWIIRRECVSFRGLPLDGIYNAPAPLTEVSPHPTGCDWLDSLVTTKTVK